MSTRKHQDTREPAASIVPAAERARKKARAPRVRLTHFEVRRGETLRLRIAIADDVIAEVGDELGALIKRITPSTQTAIIEPVPAPDFIVSRTHVEHDDGYHAQLRDNLVELFTSLCDTGLEAALDVARNERARRVEEAN